MKKLAIAFVIAASTLISCKQFQKEILISKEQIQSSLNEEFPYEKNAVLTKLTLNHAAVYFKDEKIGIKIDYFSSLLGENIKGIVDLKGKIRYNKENAAFYLHDLEIVNASMNESNFSGKDKLGAIILEIVNNYLDDYPVYQLDQENFKENLAKFALKSVSVKDENIAVTLGL